MDEARPTTPRPRATHRAPTPTDLSRLGAESETERRVKRITPWFVSIAVHLGAVALAVAVTWTVVRLRTPEDPVLIVADFEHLAYDPVKPLGAAGGMPAVDAPTELPEPAEDLLSAALAMEEDPVLMLAPAAGTGGTTAASSATLAVPASFAGLRASNARRVVYVVDASGSMIGALPEVVDELARSLRSMVPQQEFAVIFFQANEALMVPPAGRLTPARPGEQARAIAWIRDRVIPSGRSNPLRAIQEALRLDPDVVFVLSNNITGAGQFEIDQAQLLSLLDQLNPVDPVSGRRRTAIKCVQFLDQDPLETLRRIADGHGGPDGYRFISREDVAALHRAAPPQDLP